MAKQEMPKAWLPVYSFIEEGLKKYENLLEDVNELGRTYTLRCADWDGYYYHHSVTVKVKPSTAPTDSAVIELLVDKRYQAMTDEAILERLNYRRSHPTSTKWTRVMLGMPSPKVLANHVLAGVKFAAGFESNMGFTITADSNQVQNAITAILENHNAWGMPSTGSLKFLNI